MDRQAVLTELKKVLAPYTENKEQLDNITEQTDLLKDLHINSANLVDIIIDAESQYNIEIDNDFDGFLCKIANEMDLSMNNYSFMKDLVRSESNIPKPVKENLARIISSLEE